MNRWVGISLLVLAFLAAGAVYWRLFSGPEVAVVAARTGVIREFVEEQAKTRLPHTYRITMPYAGRVRPEALEEGAAVAAGQVVAQIVQPDRDLALRKATSLVDRVEAKLAEAADAGVELTTLEQALNFVAAIDDAVKAASARVIAGKARYEYALNDLQRVQKLFERKAKTEDELEQAQLREVEGRIDYEQDRLVLSSLQAIQVAANLLPPLVRKYMERRELSKQVVQQELAESEVVLLQAKTDFERGEMKSPIAGVVLERPITNEQPLASGTELLTIGRLEELEIEAEVLTQDALRVHPNDRVEILAPSLSAEPLQGAVQRIFPQGFTKISSLGVEQQRVLVVIRFTPADAERFVQSNGLGVHYRVRVRIVVAEKSQALVVPRSALVRTPQGGWQVLVVRDRRLEAQAVEVGLANDLEAEITQGLAPGDQVVPAPATSLMPGALVQPVE